MKIFYGDKVRLTQAYRDRLNDLYPDEYTRLKDPNTVFEVRESDSLLPGSVWIVSDDGLRYSVGQSHLEIVED